MAESIHEELDYDEDSVKNSPTGQTNGEPAVSSPRPTRIHAIPCRSPSTSSDSHNEVVRLDYENCKSVPSDSDDKEHNLSKSPSNSTGRIRSVINFNRDNKTPVSPSATGSTKCEEKNGLDKPHKSYESLMKYFLKDACYFQMKSINHENVALSKTLGVWSTPIQNELRLNTAFREHRNVILIFSVQQSGGFQGFARMVSEAGPTSNPVPWVLPARFSKKSLGGVFRVEWLCTKEIPFHETQDLYNPFNDNKPIKIARDGQQVEAKVGKKLCKLFPQDSRSRLLDAVSTLKRQLNHRKKFPIQVPDNRMHYHRDVHADADPFMPHHPRMPYHMPNGYAEPNYYTGHPSFNGPVDPYPPHMAAHRNRAPHHHGYHHSISPPYSDRHPHDHMPYPPPHYLNTMDRYEHLNHGYNHGPPPYRRMFRRY